MEDSKHSKHDISEYPAFYKSWIAWKGNWKRKKETILEISKSTRVFKVLKSPMGLISFFSFMSSSEVIKMARIISPKLVFHSQISQNGENNLAKADFS